MVDAPKAISGTDIPKLSDKHIKSLVGKTVAQIQTIFPTARVMDYDGNGIFDTKGKVAYGNTIDIENPFTGKTTSYHIVKKGEPGAGRAGSIETAESNTRWRFTQRTKDKTFNEIKKTYVPTLDYINDNDKDGKFTPGDSFNEILPDGRMRKYYFVKSGDIVPKVYKKILGENYTQEMVNKLYEENHTNGDIKFDVDKVIFYTFPKND